jgi:hypothetical protein
MQASSKYIGDHCKIAPIVMQLVPIYKELLKIRRLAGELTVFGGANNDEVVAAELEVARSKAQETASKSQADFAFQIRKAQATISSNDGSIHGTAGTADLALFLIKVEAEYLNYLSLILRPNTEQVARAKELFVDGSLQARTAALGEESPIRLGLAFSFARFMADCGDVKTAILTAEEGLVSWTETLIKKGPKPDAGGGGAAAAVTGDGGAAAAAGDGDAETTPQLIPTELLRPSAAGAGAGASAGTATNDASGASETPAEKVELTGIETVAALLVRNRDRWQTQLSDAADADARAQER